MKYQIVPYLFTLMAYLLASTVAPAFGAESNPHCSNKITEKLNQQQHLEYTACEEAKEFGHNAVRIHYEVAGAIAGKKVKDFIQQHSRMPEIRVICCRCTLDNATRPSRRNAQEFTYEILYGCEKVPGKTTSKIPYTRVTVVKYLDK